MTRYGGGFVMKIRRIGWTHLIYNKEGQNCMRIVRKRLFDGYVRIIDSSGKKEKMESLQDLDTLKIKGSFWTLFPRIDISSMFVWAFEQKQRAITLRSERIAKLREIIKGLRAECQKLGVDCQAKDAKIKAMSESEENRLRDILTRRQSYLMDGFESFGKHTISSEWDDVVYEQPNSLQQSIGVTSVPKRVPRQTCFEYKYNMKGYLVDLSKAVPHEYNEQVSSLIECYTAFLTACKNVSAEEDACYNAAMIKKANFINKLRDFLYFWRSKNKAADVSSVCHDSDYRSNGEKEDTWYKSYNLISQGETACAYLIEKIFGAEERDAFVAEINRLSAEEDSNKKIF